MSAPLDGRSDYIDQLNALCEDFGCSPGEDLLFWLHEQLSRIAALTKALQNAREFIDASAFNIPTKDYFDAVTKELDELLREEQAP